MKIEIRCHEVSLDEGQRALALDRIWSCLDRHEPAIDNARFSLRDENGPKGGVDLRCVVRLTLRRGGTVIARSEASHPLAALGIAAACAERTLARRLDARRA